MTDETNKLPGFGKSEYLSAADSKPGDRIKVKVLMFLGGMKVKQKDGTEKIGAYYDVRLGDEVYKFRLSKQNQEIAAAEFGIKDYPDLVGKELTLKVKKFQVGNGYELVSVV